MTWICDRCDKEVDMPIIIDAKRTKSDMPTYYIIAVTEDDHPVIHLCGDCQLKLHNWLAKGEKKWCFK